ncbi:MAG: hypothetical protein RSB94_07090 [Erysipelotrichaceae bacterium]
MISNGGTATLGLYDFKKQLDAFGGVDYFRSTLVGGYIPNSRVMLANGEIVQNSTNGNLTNNPNTDMTGWILETQIIVNSPSELLNVNNPLDGQTAFSKLLQKNFVYSSSLNKTANGVTVVGKWEMVIQDEYLADWFATPNVTLAQDAFLQIGYDYAVSVDRPFVIDGTYWVDARVNATNNANADRSALVIRSNSVLDFTGSGHLKVLPNNYTNYSVICATNEVTNYRINNARITGDRLNHDYSGHATHEWGHGIAIYESSNGYVYHPRVSQMTGDGIYIGKVWSSTYSSVPTNVTVFEPVIDHIRRNGISFTSGNNTHVIRPQISYVGDFDGIDGAFPKTGIDFEPESAEGSPKPYFLNCSVESLTVTDSYSGFYVYVFPEYITVELHLKGITTLSRCHTNSFGLFHGGRNCLGLVQIDHVYITSAPSSAIPHGWSSVGSLYANVDRITFDPNITTNLNFSIVRNGAFVDKKLGNITFNNVKSNTGFMPIVYDASDMTGFTDNSRYICDPTSPKKFDIYVGSGVFPTFGKDYIADGEKIHLGFSILSRENVNTIWLDPSVEPSTSIYITTTGDYRTLKIGLRNDSEYIGQGVNINGLNLLDEVSGTIKTEAHCRTLGGWIKFKNVVGKRTQILDSYGKWDFS